MVRPRLMWKMPDRLPLPGESWDNVGSNLHRGAIRSVCGSVPRNGCFRGYHTNTARGESKTPISRNRGEIGGKAREHIPRELIERDSKNGFYLGRRFDRRKWRDVPILEARAHNPKVVGSNPAPATKSYKPRPGKQAGLFTARGNFQVWNVYTATCLSALWKGPVSRLSGPKAHWGAHTAPEVFEEGGTKRPLLTGSLPVLRY